MTVNFTLTSGDIISMELPDTPIKHIIDCLLDDDFIHDDSTALACDSVIHFEIE
jgi:hypothetical protein